MDRIGQTIPDHLEGVDLRTYRWDRRRRHHLAAGVPGRRKKLGLSLLLVAGRNLHPDGFHAGRIPRRGAGVARLALSRSGGQPRSDPDPVRSGWRTLAAGADRLVAAGLREFGAGTYRQWRLPTIADRCLRR